MYLSIHFLWTPHPPPPFPLPKRTKKNKTTGKEMMGRHRRVVRGGG